MQYKYTVIIDFEPYLHEFLNLPRRELFQWLKRKHSLATKKGWIAKNETSGIPGENSIKSFHVDGRHYGMDFVSQTTDQNYNGVVFTNRFKKDSWDVITRKIGAGLAKLLRMESEWIYNKYWRASDWSFKEATLTKVSFVIKNHLCPGLNASIVQLVLHIW